MWHKMATQQARGNGVVECWSVGKDGGGFFRQKVNFRMYGETICRTVLVMGSRTGIPARTPCKAQQKSQASDAGQGDMKWPLGRFKQCGIVLGESMIKAGYESPISSSSFFDVRRRVGLSLAVGRAFYWSDAGWHRDHRQPVTDVTNIQAGGYGGLYIGNRAPFEPGPLLRLPPGSIQPQGWLLTMLQNQSNGLNGLQEEISPFLTSTSDWTTPNGSGATQGWERVPVLAARLH